MFAHCNRFRSTSIISLHTAQHILYTKCNRLCCVHTPGTHLTLLKPEITRRTLIIMLGHIGVETVRPVSMCTCTRAWENNVKERREKNVDPSYKTRARRRRVLRSHQCGGHTVLHVAPACLLRSVMRRGPDLHILLEHTVLLVVVAVVALILVPLAAQKRQTHNSQLSFARSLTLVVITPHKWICV